jgi:DNA-binding Lrp family transcriptional regulator
MRLTETDRSVLAIAQFNGRISHGALAKELGVRTHRARYLLDRFFDQEMLHPFVRVNLKALGFYCYRPWCTLNSQGLQVLPKIVARLKRSPQIRWIGTYCGEYNLSFTILAMNIGEVEAVLGRLIDEFGQIFTQTSVHEEWHYVIYERKYLRRRAGREPLEIEYPHIDNSEKLDKLDFSILDSLMKTPNLSTQQLSQTLGVSDSTVSYRMSRLAKQRVLLGWGNSFPYERLGLVASILLFKFEVLTPQMRERLTAFCRQHPNVVGLSGYRGEWDYSMLCETENMRDLMDIQTQIIRDLKLGIKRFSIQLASEFYRGEGGLAELREPSASV